jgi:hypothetical protein
MEVAGKIIQVKGNSMRFVGHCGGFNEARVWSGPALQEGLPIGGLRSCINAMLQWRKTMYETKHELLNYD